MQISSSSSEFCWDNGSSDADHWNSTTSSSVGEHEGEFGAALSAEVGRLLKDTVQRGETLLNLVKQYAMRTQESVVGLSKLKRKIESEVRNAVKCLDELEAFENLPLEEREDSGLHFSVVTRGKLYAQCNGIPTLELFLRTLLQQRGVVSVCTPFPLVAQHSIHSPTSSSVNACSSENSFRRSGTVEVDIVAEDGHLWIKVRGAKNSVADSVDVQKFVLTLSSMSRAAATVYVPFQRNPQLCVVLSHTPSLELQNLFEAAAKGCMVITDSFSAVDKGMAHRISFPAIENRTCEASTSSLICWDTTSLVAFCSESCYPALNWSKDERLEKLLSFKVLREQQRRELCGESAVHSFMHPFLKKNSQWISQQEIEKTLQSHIERWINDYSDECFSTTEVSSSFSTDPVEVPSGQSLCYYPDLLWLEQLIKNFEPLPRQYSTSFDELPWWITEGESNAGKERETEEREAMSELSMTRNWVIADVTYSEFKWMIETIGGQNECRRALAVLKQCVIVSTSFLRRCKPICASTVGKHVHQIAPCATEKPNTAFAYLSSPAFNISLRNQLVFGMADAIHAVALTSNKQLFSKMLSQRVTLAVTLHPSRALTELKFSQQARREGSRFPPPV